jgi:hypothetical protein
MIELNDFFNDGFGWACRKCSEELATEVHLAAGPFGPAAELARFFREGEVEGGGPRLETLALAKWTDRTRQFLACPRCGLVESVDRS